MRPPAVILAAFLAMTVMSAGQAATVRAHTVDGSIVSPFAGGGRRATVLFFVTNDCPVANSYAPEIKRIAAAYTPRQVGFYLVYVDPSLSRQNAKKHMRDFGYTFPALLDPSLRLVHLAHASITPEAAVFAPDGKLIYHGRIDDRAVDFGQVRSVATTHDLRDTLDAVLNNRPVPHAVTHAFGCYIADLNRK